MDSIGIALHERESRLCIITEHGEVLEQRVVASHEPFTTVPGPRFLARIRLEV